MYDLPSHLTLEENDFIGSDGCERKEASSLLHVTPDSFSSMLSRGELQLGYAKVGKRKRIYSRRQILALIRSRRVTPEVAA